MQLRLHEKTASARKGLAVFFGTPGMCRLRTAGWSAHKASALLIAFAWDMQRMRI